MAEEVDSDPEELPPSELLLLCARRGQLGVIEELLASQRDGKIDLDINCKGTQKSNRGWTPLHLASYFGHKDVVELLLKNGASVNAVNNIGDTALHRAAHTGRLNGASVNAVNNIGDTALHRAAHTGRLDVVTVLLQHGADMNIINAEGQTAKQATNNEDIVKLIEAAEKHEESRLEEEFMSSVRLGDVNKVESLVSTGKVSKVNCQDSFGNTALHVAAQAGQQEVAVYLLQKGINSELKNKQGQAASDVAKNDSMKQLLTVVPKTDPKKPPQRFEGVLIKRSFVGAKAMWVVLERGVLSYFKNRGDASTGSKRLSMKYLDEAEIMVHSENDFNFLVRYSDGTSHKLQIDSTAGDYRIGREPVSGEKINRQSSMAFNEYQQPQILGMIFRWFPSRKLQIDSTAGDYGIGREPVSGEKINRQMWVNALKEHINYNTHYIHKGLGKEPEPDNQISSLEEALKVAQAHQGVLQQQVSKVSTYLNKSQGQSRTGVPAVKLESELSKVVSHSKDMCSSLDKCLTLFKQQEEIKGKLLHEEKEKNRVLQEALHALAIEHQQLEQSYSHSVLSRRWSMNADEFFDCDDVNGIDFHRPLSLSPGAQSRISAVSDALSFKSCQFDLDDDEPIDAFTPVDLDIEPTQLTNEGDSNRGRVKNVGGARDRDTPTSSSNEYSSVTQQSNLGGSISEESPPIK